MVYYYAEGSRGFQSARLVDSTALSKNSRKQLLHCHNLSLHSPSVANFYRKSYFKSLFQVLLLARCFEEEVGSVLWNMYSYNDIHTLTKRATPLQLQIYKLAIFLFNLYNSIKTTSDWVRLNFQQTLTSRQMNFIITQTNNYKIGNNLICNRLSLLNNKIPLKWLTLPLETFKLKCKEKFLNQSNEVQGITDH